MPELAVRPSPAVGRLLAVLLGALVVVAACGGDDDAESTASDDGAGEATDEIAAVEDDPPPADGGPIDGALVSVLTFEFGLWALDPAGGDAVELVVPDAGYSDRLEPALTTPDGSRAYVIVYTQVDGQSFTNRVGVGEIDLTDGTGRLVTELGQDRADDEATDTMSWELLGVADDTVWVAERAGQAVAVLAIDPASDSVSVVVEAAEESVRSTTVLDGTLYGQIGGDIVALGAAGWESVLALNDLAVDAAFDVASIDDFAITRSGDPLDDVFAEDVLRFFEPRPTSAGMAAAGDLLYWQFNTNTTSIDGESAILGGFVEFDPAAGVITQAWPIGPSVGAFTGENEISTSSQGTWHVTDGVVWFADARDDGDLLRLDPASGVTAFDVPPIAGADYTRIELVPNDPDGVWLLVEDWTITSEDESGRSASGETRFQLMDPQTGEALVVVDESDLIGF